MKRLTIATAILLVVALAASGWAMFCDTADWELFETAGTKSFTCLWHNQSCATSCIGDHEHLDGASDTFTYILPPGDSGRIELSWKPSMGTTWYELHTYLISGSGTKTVDKNRVHYHAWNYDSSCGMQKVTRYFWACLCDDTKFRARLLTADGTMVIKSVEVTVPHSLSGHAAPCPDNVCSECCP